MFAKVKARSRQLKGYKAGVCLREERVKEKLFYWLSLYALHFSPQIVVE
jgi:hypothetical protein